MLVAASWRDGNIPLRCKTGAFRGVLALAMLELFLVGIPGPVAAQRGIALSRFRPAADADSFLTVQSSRVLSPGRFTFQHSLDWSVDPLSVGPADVPVVEHQVAARVQFQVGVLDRMTMVLDVPWVLHQSTEASRLGDGGGPLPGSAAGNPRFLSRVRLLEPTTDEDRGNDQLGLAVQAGVSPPLGERNSLVADRDWLVEAHVLLDYHLLGAGVGVSVGARFRLDDEKEALAGSRVLHELDVGLGIKIPFVVVPDLWGLLEFRWIADLSEDFGFSGPTNVLEGNLGARYVLDSVAITAALGTEIAPGFGSPAFRAYVAVGWAPVKRDADGDGVPDAADQCAFLAEDLDGFEDGDGCPDPDNDNDFVFDDEDRCPNEAAEEFRDEDEDGCTDPNGGS